MLAYSWSSWSLIELIWTLLSFAGLSRSLFLLVESVHDRAALLVLGRNGERRIFAAALILGHALRSVGFAFFVAGGIVAGFTEPGAASRNMIAFILIAAVVMLVANAEVSAWSRRAVVREREDE